MATNKISHKRVGLVGGTFDLPGTARSRRATQMLFMETVQQLAPTVLEKLLEQCYSQWWAFRQLAKEANPTLDHLANYSAALEAHEHAVDAWAADVGLDAPWCKGWAKETLRGWGFLHENLQRDPRSKPRLGWIPTMIHFNNPIRGGTVESPPMPWPEWPALTMGEPEYDLLVQRSFEYFRDQYKERVRQAFKTAECPLIPQKEEGSIGTHVAWLVRFQVLREEYVDIYRSVKNIPADEQVANTSTVKKRVGDMATLIGLRLRKSRDGRPPKAKHVKR